MTSKKLGMALLSLVVLAIFAVAPVAAAANSFATNISTGDTIFIGESDLDITSALNGTSAIAWYSSGSKVGEDTPAKVLTLTPASIVNFYVDQGSFGNFLGPWYAYTDAKHAEFAFYVEQPSLAVGIYREDGITSIDGKKLIADEYATMKIESTFSTLFQRALTPGNLEDNVQRFDVGEFVTIGSENVGVWNTTVPGKEASSVNLSTLVDAWEAAGYVLGENLTYALNASVPGVNAYAIAPNNAKMNALWTDYGYFVQDTTSLKNLHPDVSNYMLNNGLPVWSAGEIIDIESQLGHKILTGEYKFYAEININGMKDNLGEISGKTRSNTATVTIDKETVTITADKETVIRNNGFSVKVEGNPKSLYAVWFTGVSGYNYGEVPAFVKDQQDVTPMTYAQAYNTSYKSSLTKIATDLPEGVSDGDDFTGNYAIIAKTNAAGVINIGLITNENTKDTTFTIRAERVQDRNPFAPTNVNGYDLGDYQLYDTVKVKIEKGAVTVSASGDGSYYLGEEVTLSGTNTDSDDVYLFITGPNLPVAGGKLDDPKKAPEDAEDSTKINVKTDDTWEYKWDTSGSILDAGTYTIYATSDFALKSGTPKTLSDVKYDTVSVVIKKPFVTATTSASTVAKGDKLYIRGTAEGEPTVGVGVWILGKNYWNGEKTDLSLSSMVTETVNDDGSFEYELGSADTKDLASGQYFVVVQHPMYNGVFDVRSSYNAYETTVQVITNPKGTQKLDDKGVNGVAFIIAGNGKLQGSDAAEALIQAINSANVDDTYTKLTFLVEEPWIRVNSVGDHYIGDQFKITGTTNLAIGDNLIVEVTSSSFQPTQKTQSGEFSGVSSTVKVTEGSSYNEWALDVDASTFKADEYIVNVEAIEADVTTTTTFNILTGSATVAPTTAPTTAPTSAPTSAPTTAPTPAATASPGFGALVALIGLGAVAALIIRKD